MPFTPFHFGPSFLIGLLFSKIFDLPALLVSSIAVDVEHIFNFFFHIPGWQHKFLHNILGGSVVALITAIVLYSLKEPTKKLMKEFNLAQHSSFKKILWTSFFGAYFHVFLDSFLYEEMEPFFPFKNNPFLGVVSFEAVYLFCSLSFLIAILVCLIKFADERKVAKNNKN